MRYVLGILTGVCCLGFIGLGNSEENLPIQAHSDTQALIEKWVATGDAGSEEHYALLAKLEPLARHDHERFVGQLAYAYFKLRRENKPGREFVEELYKFCRVQKRESATALANHLYGHNDAARKLAWELFVGSLGKGYPPGYGDLSHLREFVTGNRHADPRATPIKRAVFEVTPNSAFRLFRAQESRDQYALAKAEHTLQNALFEHGMNKGVRTRAKQKTTTEQRLPPPWKLDESSIEALRELATSKHWWARMFASEFMVHNKEFRVEELIEKLEQDENDLVRQSAVSINTPDPLRAPIGPLRP